MGLIRRSTQDDKEAIRHLMSLGFGDRDNVELYDNLDNRFWLYFKDDELVAMTGLMLSKEYGALEVDWTCTHPDHRHNGYMQALFREMLMGIKVPVYCSCWRMPDRDRVNLQTVMDMFGFKEIIKPRVTWKVPYNCSRNFSGGCVNYKGGHCTCYEDLYLREPSSEE